MGFGWIMRLSDGSLVVAGHICIKRPWRIVWLEALAVTEGLKLLSDQSPGVQVELDCLWVVKLLNDKEEDATELWNFILEAKALIPSTNIESIIHVARRNNAMAHILARKASESSSFVISQKKKKSSSFASWSNNFPS